MYLSTSIPKSHAISVVFSAVVGVLAQRHQQRTKIFILEIRINLALLQSIKTEIWNNTLFDVIRCWCRCARTPTTAEKDTKGWKEGIMTRTSGDDKGWTLHQLNNRGTDVTDLYIQYHPGTRRHFDGKPYWKFSSGQGGVQRFKAAE